MSDAKHTDGPWMVGHSTGLGTYIYAIDPDVDDLDPEKQRMGVAEIIDGLDHRRDVDDRLVAANARLIAESPTAYAILAFDPFGEQNRTWRDVVNAYLARVSGGTEG